MEEGVEPLLGQTGPNAACRQPSEHASRGQDLPQARLAEEGRRDAPCYGVRERRGSPSLCLEFLPLGDSGTPRCPRRSAVGADARAPRLASLEIIEIRPLAPVPTLDEAAGMHAGIARRAGGHFTPPPRSEP